MMSLIERLHERAHDPNRGVDERPETTPGSKPAITTAAPPATKEQVAAVERKFGFPLPSLLRTLYLEIGNGGFGPGYGLIALGAAATDTNAPLEVQYATLTKAQTRPAWPIGLIPLCEWGAGIGSFLDCTSPEHVVVRIDPNMPKTDVALRVPERLHYARASQIKDACWIEAASLEEWLQAWVDGSPLFYLAYGTPDDQADEEEDSVEDEE